MPILSLKKVSLAYGHLPLLSDVNLQVKRGERVCLVGRNGTGKSTLFRVLTGEAQPDDGEVWHKDTLRISHLQQDVPEDTHSTIFEVVAAGLGELGELLSDYHNLSAKIDNDNTSKLIDLQHRIDVLEGWNINQKVETVLSRLSLPENKLLSECSGGIRRRVLLAQALVSDPDLLLLDEPTNHMDIDSITWLEEFLLNFRGALIFITHDRSLIKRLSSRIIELDRGNLTSYPGNYEQYLERKQKMLEAEEKANSKFDKKLSEQEIWIRKGIKARRTRNEGRVRQLIAMRQDRRQRVNVQSSVRLEIDKGHISGKLVVELRDIAFHYESLEIIKNFSTTIMRGDRIGIVGANGSGKSTLLKLLLGELKPGSGWITRGTNLDVAYFDQQRHQLKLDKTVLENISDGGEQITINGRTRHVVSYMNDFLFPSERIHSPVKSLSGGEKNRLLLAQIFTQPANLLVLDEPTNDLDIETLELLEELLAEYAGTLLLVSHDRTFLDRVVTSTIVFEGEGEVNEYIGGYEDWLRQRSAKQPPKKTVEEEKTKSSKKPAKHKTKLSYLDQRELDSLPAKIEQLEVEQQQLETETIKPEFYKQDQSIITEKLSELDALRKELEYCYARWQTLDSMQMTN